MKSEKIIITYVECRILLKVARETGARYTLARETY